MLKIKEAKKATIVNPLQMKKGNIGIIISWSGYVGYVGTIVMKVDD